MTEKEFVSHDWANRVPVSISTMLKAVDSKVTFIPATLDSLLPQVDACLERLGKPFFTNVYLIGCGDSLYAATAARLAFDKHSGVRAEVVESLEFSRYVAPYLPADSLVIGISSGGGTSRTIEGILRAKKKGALTAGITATLGSRMVHEADTSLVHDEWAYRVPAPAGEGTFSLGGFSGAMLALYLLALELGRRNGKVALQEQSHLVELLRSAGQTVEQTAAACREPIRQFARSVAGRPAYFILGGGPSYATALYSAAKLFEMPQVNGVAILLEEWSHEQYFLAREDSVITFILPPGPSLGRAYEQIAGAKAMGATVVAVCSASDAETQSRADVVFPVAGSLPEEFSPLAYCVPGELFALWLCDATNKPAFAFINKTQFEVNRQQVGQSAIVVDE